MQHKQHLPPRQGVTLRKVGTLPPPSVRLPRSERVSGARLKACRTTTTSPTPTLTTIECMVGLAGHHVADNWLQTRARVEEGLLAAGARAVEGHPKGPHAQ